MIRVRCVKFLSDEPTKIHVFRVSGIGIFGVMPHPRRLVNPKIPRFSNIVKSDAPAALQSPHAHENLPVNGLPAPAKQPFNPRVAAYTLAFVSVLVGGLYIGAKWKEITEFREVFIYSY
jgi:hypothetical protein